ncbi:hypothetical protein SLS58_006676 [Diplodia intermedia]|uniref:Uncharacterized protein n=1 Tax=Diplodia intermedia TaxID=856260 RepID=A0ABR3TME3_9PEZI
MEQQPEFPLARVLLAIIPAALVFLFFVSVLFVPVHSASDELRSPRDVMVVLDDDAPAMAYGAWLEAQRRKAASSHVFENAIWCVCPVSLSERRGGVVGC